MPDLSEPLAKAGITWLLSVVSGDATGAVAAGGVAAYESVRKRLSGPQQQSLEGAVARIKQDLVGELNALAGSWRHEAVLADFEMVIRVHGPRLADAVRDHGCDPDKMTVAALRSAARMLGQSEEAHATVVRRVVRAFYASAMRDHVVLQQLEPHIAIATLGKLDQLRDAVGNVPEATADRIAQRAAEHLLELPCRAWLNRLKNATPATLLRAEYAVVDFVGRSAEINDLLAWCHLDKDPLRIRIYSGPGGQGKSRLMLELARRLHEAGWTAGRLKPLESGGPHDEAIVQLVRNGSVFVILDDAETRIGDIKKLLKTAHEVDCEHLRLVLLSRAPGQWWTDLQISEWPVSDILKSATGSPMVLAPLSNEQLRTDALFEAAREDFARVLQKPLLPAAPHLGLSDLSTALEIQTAALLTLLGDEVKPTKSLFDDLLGWEERRWRTRLSSLPNLGISESRALTDGLKLILAAVTLVGGVTDRASARQLCSSLPLSADLTEHHLDEILSLLAELYGGFRSGHDARFIGPLRPDRVGETLIARALERWPDLSKRLLSRLATPALMSLKYREWPVEPGPESDAKNALLSIHDRIELWRAWNRERAQSLDALSRNLFALGRSTQARIAGEASYLLRRRVSGVRSETSTSVFLGQTYARIRACFEYDRAPLAHRHVQRALDWCRPLFEELPEAYAEEFAEALLYQGRLLAKYQRPGAAESFRLGISALRDSYLRFPASCGPLMRALVKRYRDEAIATNTSPDEVLIAPIEAVLASVSDEYPMQQSY